MRPAPAHRLPLRNLPRQLRIILVPDKGPALLVAQVIVRAAPVLDQRLGVLEIAVDGLDGGPDPVFLYIVNPPPRQQMMKKLFEEKPPQKNTIDHQKLVMMGDFSCFKRESERGRERENREACLPVGSARPAAWPCRSSVRCALPATAREKRR